MDDRIDQLNFTAEKCDQENVSSRRDMLCNLGAASVGALAINTLTSAKNAEAVTAVP